MDPSKMLWNWVTGGRSACLCNTNQMLLDYQLAELFNENEHDDSLLLTTLQSLLKFGANPNLELDDGNRLLHVLVDQRRVEFAEELLQNGAMANFTNMRNDTPLHFATKIANPKQNDADMVYLLLKYKADPNLPGDGDNTPMHWAARTGSYDMAVALLAAGADPTRENERGQSSVTLARDAKHVRVTRLLVGAATARFSNAKQNRLPQLAWLTYRPFGRGWSSTISTAYRSTGALTVYSDNL